MMTFGAVDLLNVVVTLASAALRAEYCRYRGLPVGRFPYREVTFMILRNCEEGMERNSWIMCMAERKIFLYSYSHTWSSLISPGRASPALFTNTSIARFVFLISSNIEVMCSRFIRSPW